MSVDVTTKEGRQQCWDARDVYWKCLDVNVENQNKCKLEREKFEKDCSKAWVSLIIQLNSYICIF